MDIKQKKNKYLTYNRKGVSVMDYNDMKLEIYESYMAGNINDTEKLSLINRLNDIDPMLAYCEKYGLIPVDEEDVYFEGLSAALGKFLRDKIDMKEIRKSWENMSMKFQHAWRSKPINEDEKKKLKHSYDKVKQPNITYNEYKKHFAILAKSVNLPSVDIILENVIFKHDDKKKSDVIAVRFSKGKQKVMIPNGTCLLHVSPVKGLREMKPSFRSKTVGKYMYPSPRCFFTLAKEIKPTKAGLENKKTYKYTPKETLKFGYIDPSYTTFADGSVFIETKLPIAVMDFNEKMKKMALIESTNYNAEELKKRFKIQIYESEMLGRITEDQQKFLLEHVDMIE